MGYCRGRARFYTWLVATKKKSGGRVTPKGGNKPGLHLGHQEPTVGSNSRYTPPVPEYVKHSAPWVPVLMFTLLGIGIIVILLNYVQLLPGATDNWYLLLGLGFILGGIITATQFR